jgi:hypothetical protein
MNNLLKAGIRGLLVVSILVGAILCGCSSPTQPTPTPPASTQPTPTQADPTLAPSPGSANYVELVYFHRSQRCRSCQYAGDMTQYTVENYFSDELADGRLVFKVLNVQDPANGPTIEKYGAYGSCLFMDVLVDGEDHVQQIADIWYHVGNDEEFIGVVRTEIKEALESI